MPWARPQGVAGAEGARASWSKRSGAGASSVRALDSSTIALAKAGCNGSTGRARWRAARSGCGPRASGDCARSAIAVATAGVAGPSTASQPTCRKQDRHRRRQEPGVEQRPCCSCGEPYHERLGQAERVIRPVADHARSQGSIKPETMRLRPPGAGGRGCRDRWAEMASPPGSRAAAAGLPAARRSILFQTSRRGVSPSSMSFRMRSTAPTCCSCAGSAASTRCSSRSASLQLLQRGPEGLRQVARQIADEPHGVGDDHARARRWASRSRRVVGSSVANSLSSASTSLRGERVQQRGLAGVGVADDGHHRDAPLVALRRGARPAAARSGRSPAPAGGCARAPAGG